MGGISEGESNFQFPLKLVSFRATRRVRFGRDMDHVVRHLACEVIIVYCSSIHHLNLTYASGFEHALILL